MKLAGTRNNLFFFYLAPESRWIETVSSMRKTFYFKFQWKNGKIVRSCRCTPVCNINKWNASKKIITIASRSLHEFSIRLRLNFEPVSLSDPAILRPPSSRGNLHEFITHLSSVQRGPLRRQMPVRAPWRICYHQRLVPWNGKRWRLVIAWNCKGRNGVWNKGRVDLK